MISRRGFIGAAFPLWTEYGFAQRALVGSSWPPDTVWLNANENPDGPCPASLEAMRNVLPQTWRYHFPEFLDFYAAVAKRESLEPGHVLVGAGSTEILHAAVDAFTSPERPLITVEPTFEAPAEVASTLGHRVIRLGLTENFGTPVKALALAARKSGAGLIYLCNPNNPTSSITPKAEIDWLVEQLPAETVLLIDEAYLHFVPDSEAQSGLAHVRQEKNVVVARTFSKIYGMAGLRVGYGCARPDLIARMAPFRDGVISIVGARAAMAALKEAPRLIPQRRASLIKTRSTLCSWLKSRGLCYIEPHANFVMIDTGRDVRSLIGPMLERGVAVGRPFPPLNRMLRVTIGTEKDMARFRQAFSEVCS